MNAVVVLMNPWICWGYHTAQHYLFLGKIADYLNRENAADLIYLNLTKILAMVSPWEMISYAGENGD